MREVTIHITGPGSSVVGKLVRNALTVVGFDNELEDDTTAGGEIQPSRLISAAEEMIDEGTLVRVVVGVPEPRGNA